MRDHLDPTEPVGDGPTRLVHRLPPDIAEQTARRLREEIRAVVTVGDRADGAAALINEQRSEARDTAGGPPVGVVAGSQARGAIKWALAGGLLGAVIGALIGLLPIQGIELGPRVGLLAIIGFMAGAAAGFVYGGGRQPELEGDLRNTTHEVAISVTAEHADDVERAEAILSEADVQLARRAKATAAKDGHHAFDEM